MIVFSSSLQHNNNLTKYEGFFVFDLWLEIISRLWKKSVGFLLPISSFLHVISDAIILDPSEKKTSDFQENIWHPLFQCLFSEHIFHYFVSFPGFLFTLQANGGNCERESFWKRVWHQTGAPLCPWLPSLEIPLYFLPLSLIQFTITTINITIIRGGVKKMFFFTFHPKGVGGSRPIQKILIRKYSDFLTNFDQFLTNFDQFLTSFLYKPPFFAKLCKKIW